MKTADITYYATRNKGALPCSVYVCTTECRTVAASIPAKIPLQCVVVSPRCSVLSHLLSINMHSSLTKTAAPAAWPHAKPQAERSAIFIHAFACKCRMCLEGQRFSQQFLAFVAGTDIILTGDRAVWQWDVFVGEAVGTRPEVCWRLVLSGCTLDYPKIGHKLTQALVFNSAMLRSRPHILLGGLGGVDSGISTPSSCVSSEDEVSWDFITSPPDSPSCIVLASEKADGVNPMPSSVSEDMYPSASRSCTTNM
eukprot:jgi/Botrbrau1/11944/Bobra.341_1s0011.1